MQRVVQQRLDFFHQIVNTRFLGFELVVVDLASDRVVDIYVLPQAALVKASALKDIRVDLGRGDAGTVFITDNAPNGQQAFIVVDLASRRALRRLAGHPSTAPPSDLVMYAGSEALMVSTPDGQRRPYSAGLNRLAISPDGGHIAVNVDAQRLQVWDLAALREQFRELGLDWGKERTEARSTKP